MAWFLVVAHEQINFRPVKLGKVSRVRKRRQRSADSQRSVVPGSVIHQLTVTNTDGKPLPEVDYTPNRLPSVDRGGRQVGSEDHLATDAA
jgi:hypothetical protein